MSERGVIVGVDVGGTFTDLFLLRCGGAARFRTAKVPSRRGDEAQGFLNGLRALGGAAAIGSIVHGTTVGTNTLLERRGPKIGVITTRGFRDVLEMRRRDRRRTWGLWGDFMPIADRDMRVEVDERTLADGTHPHARSMPAEVRAAAQAAPGQGRAGARDHLHQCLCQCRERAPRARRRARRSGRTSFVTASHEVLSGNPRVRALLDRRRSTPICSRSSPPISASSKRALADAEFPGQLHIVQSNGGIMSTATARKLPVRTALSGPAAGVVAGAAHRARPRASTISSPAISAAPRSTSR